MRDTKRERWTRRTVLRQNVSISERITLLLRLRLRIFLITHFCYFAKGSSLLPEVDHHAATTVLRLLDGLLDTEDKVGSAGTNIGSEDIATIALFTVSPDSQIRGRNQATLTSS